MNNADQTLTKEQIERIIELMDNVTMNINTVNILTTGSEFEREGTDLWHLAYDYKKRFIDMLKQLES